MMLRTLLLTSLIGLLFAGCAKAPLGDYEAAEYILARAYHLKAPEHAATEYLAAQSAMADARGYMASGDYALARESLEFTKLHARRAINIADEAEQRLADQAEAERLAAKEAARQAAEEASRQEARRKADSRKATPPAPKQPMPTPAPAPLDEYTVGEGEALWTISALKPVYGDALLWPLLYQANRDQIKDPRQIYPGQVLSIPRGQSPEDLEDARQKARESGIFPPLPEKPEETAEKH